jgi:hypothetical protein
MKTSGVYSLRRQVFVVGAILGLAGKQVALKLSHAWGGLAKHRPLLDAILQWTPPTSPSGLNRRRGRDRASPPRVS